jgi:hypothetical protein
MLGWNTALVPPKGSIQLPVIFVPSKDSGPKTVISGKLILITAYGEQHVVEIRGKCFSSFVVFDSKIDYGPCDVDIESLTRSIVLENRDNSKKLPISLEYSSPEFYHSKDGCSRANIELVGKYGFTLEPSERLKLPIIFRPSYAGSRVETVTITAPNAPSYVVELLAQVSCNPSIPFSSEIHLPSVPPRGQSSIIVPIYNPYNSATTVQGGIVSPGIQFVISMSKKSAFTMKASGLFISNQSIVTCQPTENADPSLDSFKVVFSKPGTFFMDLSFNPAKGGIYRTAIMIQTISPKKLNPPSTFIHVYGLCMSENYYKAKTLPVLRQVYSKDDEKRRTFQDYEWILGDIIEPLQAPPEIFKLNRSFISIVCNSPSNLSAPAAKAKPTLTITNVSAIQQKFQILMSYPFTTDLTLPECCIHKNLLIFLLALKEITLI